MEQSSNAVSKQKIGRRAWTIGEVFKRMDAFGQNLPSFNIKGNDTISTILGGIVSLALIMVVMMYGGLRFSHLIEKHNPNISAYFQESGMSNGKIMNVN